MLLNNGRAATAFAEIIRTYSPSHHNNLHTLENKRSIILQSPTFAKAAGIKSFIIQLNTLKSINSRISESKGIPQNDEEEFNSVYLLMDATLKKSFEYSNITPVPTAQRNITDLIARATAVLPDLLAAAAATRSKQSLNAVSDETNKDDRGVNKKVKFEKLKETQTRANKDSKYRQVPAQLPASFTNNTQYRVLKDVVDKRTDACLYHQAASVKGAF
jgi:hypothetical protein